MRQRRNRAGFTLVELLVVLAIIGVLMGLLLPAVQMARESARQTSCRDHLRQMGLALHQFHDGKGHFPIGCLEWRAVPSQKSRRQWAWTVGLLPYIEQSALSDLIDPALAYDHVANQPAVAQVVPLFLCPNVPGDGVVRGKGRCDYGGLYGEQITQPAAANGTFLYEKPVRMAEIRDGLSQTLIVAEDAYSPDGQWSNGRNVFLQSGGINDPNAWPGDNEIRSAHPAVAMALFADGHVATMPDETQQTVLAALITRAGREIVHWP